MTEYIYTSTQPSGSSQRPSVKGNATGSPVAIGAGGVSLLGATVGVATLVAGTVTVANTSVGANSLIFVTNSALGTVAAPKFMTITRSNGVSFTITSTDGTDTSKVSYLLIP